MEFWLPGQLPVFGMGFVLFFVSQRLQPLLPQWEGKKKKAGLMVAAVILACALGPFVPKYLFAVFLSGIVFVALAVTLLIHPFRFFVNGFTVYLGKISYSVYLTHSAVLLFAPSFMAQLDQWTGEDLPPLFKYVLGLAATLVATVTGRPRLARFTSSGERVRVVLHDPTPGDFG